LCNQLLKYMDPEAIDNAILKALSLNNKKELMEAACDLKCFGDALDRIGTDDKKQLFESLKALYDRNGKRFRHLKVDMTDGCVLWEEAAPWTRKDQTESPLEVNVVLHAWANHDKEIAVKLTQDHLMGDIGPFKVIMPFSVQQAALKSESTGDCYTLSTLIPASLRKTLKARPSDELGATNLARKSFAVTQEEVRAKRAQAKKKGTGVRSLVVKAAPTTAVLSTANLEKSGLNAMHASSATAGMMPVPAAAPETITPVAETAAATSAPTENTGDEVVEPESPPGMPEEGTTPIP
jgi:hypothetical protein